MESICFISRDIRYGLSTHRQQPSERKRVGPTWDADMQHVHEHDAPQNQAPTISRREEMHEIRNTSCVHRTGRQERVLVLGRTSTWVCGVPPTPFARPQYTHGAPYLVLGLASRTRSLHGTCSRIPCQPRHSSKGRRRRRARAQSYLRKLPVTESIASGER